VTRQTLQVLANMGALYWSEALFDETVIIGQAWALAGIYAALDRKEESAIYQDLKSANGRFTRQFLHDRVWSKKEEYTEEGVQRLLISFMVDCQICFPLRERYWDGYRFHEEEFVSLKHLPKGEGSFGAGEGTVGELLKEELVLRNRYMNQFHWHAILAELGKAYGAAAEYALDGFFLPENDKGQSVLLSVKIKPGLHEESEIYLRVEGEDADDLKEKVVNELISHLPDSTSGKLLLKPKGALRIAGDLTRQVSLFISYARNKDHTTDPDDYPYEDPVNLIEERLTGVERNIKVLRDQNEIRDVAPNETQTSVMEFMKTAGDADYILVVHSGKYWMSQYCMYEAWKGCKGRAGEEILFLDLGAYAETQGISQPAPEEIDDYWLDFQTNGKLSKGLTGENGPTASLLGGGAKPFHQEVFADLQEHKNQSQPWNPEKFDEIISWIVERCGFEAVKEGD